MVRKKHVLILVSLVLIISLVYLFFPSKKSHTYPNANVILIIIDTLRADHLGCYGYARNTSPELDKLANEGIIFKNMMAQSSWTRPGTASILTGLYPKHHGANTRVDRLAEEINLLPEILGQHGYRSFAFLTNGNVGAVTGFSQGYTKFFYFKEKPKEVDPNIHVRSDLVNESLLKFIRQLEDTSRNFIYIHYSDTHEPHIPKEKNFSRANKTIFTIDKFQPAYIRGLKKEQRPKFIKEMINAYDDEIWYNDKMIGHLIQTLKEKNMYSNSIIIITSDHGQEFFEHKGFSHGKTLYEEQLNIPLIIRLPGGVHRMVEELANQVDIMPTILSLLELPVPGYVDGIDLLKNRKPAAKPFSYAELNLDKKIFSSIQTKREKLIEGIVIPKKKKHQFGWFKESAVLETSADLLELHIRSFRRDRRIQVLLDEQLIDEFVITRVKKKYNIPLPKFPNNKIVTIKSLTPCESPAKYGMKDKRCLAFFIFNSKNVNINNIAGEIYKEYYVLADDPGERNNRYDRNEFKKIIMRLRKKLKQYKLTRRFFPSDKKPIKFDKEQLEALKALGYIN
ncbi:MAG: sulfatase [Candidatus Aminicenantes bacterium]|jgi:arylsulfatase A-like enzyme